MPRIFALLEALARTFTAILQLTIVAVLPDIVMTGGGSLVEGFDKLITARTGIHTQVAEDAISCVALGTGKSLDNLGDMTDGTVNLSRRRQMN